MPQDNTHPIRCFCARQPILAAWGHDKNGKPFIHIKSWKQQRIYVEAILTEGSIRVKCRDCFRWHKLGITKIAVESVPEKLPQHIGIT